METARLLQPITIRAAEHPVSVPSFSHPPARYMIVDMGSPAQGIADADADETDNSTEPSKFAIAFTAKEMGVHIVGSLVTLGLIVLSVWITIANISL